VSRFGGTTSDSSENFLATKLSPGAQKDMRFDLHVHSIISSCSILEPEEILLHARSRGLDGVCITDHDTMAIAAHLAEGVQDDGLVVIFGMEYATLDGDFLLFGPFEDLEPGLPAAEVLPLVTAMGGVAVAAHPFRLNRMVSDFVLRDGLCTHVEVVNGRNSELENRQVALWRRQFTFFECGGSDAHCIDELGRVLTRVDGDVRTREDLIRLLTKGRCTPYRNLGEPGVTFHPRS
jgi:predicted metal-dependent phosphoesterase TrpH